MNLRAIRLKVVPRTTRSRSREIAATIRSAARSAGSEDAVAFAIVVLHSDGSIGTTHDADNNQIALLGGIDILRERLMDTFRR